MEIQRRKAWVSVVGLLVHLLSRKILGKIGDAYGSFLVDEDTMMLSELF